MLRFVDEKMQMLTETRLQTQSARRGLRKICQHFARSVPVSLYGLQCRIELPNGPCRIEATDTHLDIRISVDSAENIDRIEQDMTRLLTRLVKPKNSRVDWARTLSVGFEVTKDEQN